MAENNTRAVKLTLVLLSTVLVVAIVLGLRQSDPGGIPAHNATSDPPADPPADIDEDTASTLRHRMVERQLRGRDITNEAVLRVMRSVPRHLFVPARDRVDAYSDHPVPIGHGQTISQPYIVGLMTQLVSPHSESRVLDIGTGSGYQAAVLARLATAATVYSIEIVPPLADEAARRLKDLGYHNVEVRCGDGYRGWPEHAPFDAIIVAAAADHLPKPLLEQLAVGGRLVMPVGEYYQELIVCQKRPDGTIVRDSVIPVRFVPMTGEARADR